MKVVIFLMVVIASTSAEQYLRYPDWNEVSFSMDDIPAVLKKNGLNVLGSLVEKAKLTSVLSGPGPFTVFAPTDEAFSKLNKEVLDELSRNVTALQEVLKYHVVSGKYASSQLNNDMLIHSVQGQDIRINIYDSKIVTSSGRVVTKANQMCSNGIVHIIDEVMMIPRGDLNDELMMNPQLDTLKLAVRIAGLMDQITMPGPFTAFAPYNRAFDAIPVEQIDQALTDVDLLTDVLSYHVVSGTFYSAGLMNYQMVTSLEGQNLEITMNKESVMVNSANVIMADIPVTNGVVHIIDQALVPSMLKRSQRN